MSSTPSDPQFGPMVDDVAARVRRTAAMRKIDTVGAPEPRPRSVKTSRTVPPPAAALFVLLALGTAWTVSALLPDEEPGPEPAPSLQEEGTAAGPDRLAEFAAPGPHIREDIPPEFDRAEDPPHPDPSTPPVSTQAAITESLPPSDEPFCRPAHACAPQPVATSLPTTPSPASVAEPAAPPVVRHIITIEPGDSLLGIIGNHEVPTPAILAAVAGLEPNFDPSALHVGDKLAFVLESPIHSDEEDAPSTLLELAILPRNKSKAGHHWQGASYGTRKVIEVIDGVSELRIPPNPKDSIRYLTGSVRSNFYQAAINAGASSDETLALISILEGSLDFSRDVRKNDRFEALIEGDEGKRASVRYVSFTGHQNNITYYRTDFADGSSGHYDAQGRSYDNLLNFTPLKNSRVTSGYGFRLHPIRRAPHLHRGIDFRARNGTPIPAAGAGVVVERGWRGGYGRYLRVRHNGRYMTAYAHMKGFAKGTNIGSRIKRGQVIGYVGSSGMSTGPHLHFEVLVDGRHADPRKVGNVRAPHLSESRLAAFHELTTKTDTLVERMRTLKVAEAAREQQ